MPRCVMPRFVTTTAVLVTELLSAYCARGWRTGLLAAALGLLCFCAAVLAQPFAYVVTTGPRIYAVDTRTFAIDTIEAGLETRDVAVSSDGRRAFVTGQEGRVVNNLVAEAGRSVIWVIDIATQRITRAFPLNGARRIALSPDGTLAYVTGYDSTGTVATLSTVETVTGKIRGTVPLGINPYGVAVSPDGALVYVANSGVFQGTEPGTVSVIDPGSQRIVNTVQVGQNPGPIAVSPTGDAVYVGNYSLGFGSVAVIDAATGAVADMIQVGFVPTGIAFVPNHHLVLITNGTSDTASLIDTRLRRITCTLPLPPFMSPEGVAVQADGTVAYAISEGGLFVIDVAENRLVRTVPVAGSGIAVGACPTDGCPPPAPTRTPTATPIPTGTPSQENGCNEQCDDRECPAPCAGSFTLGYCSTENAGRCECTPFECFPGCCQMNSEQCTSGGFPAPGGLYFQCMSQGGTFFSGYVCNESSGTCEPPPPSATRTLIPRGGTYTPLPTPTTTPPRVVCSTYADCYGRPICSAQGLCCDTVCDRPDQSCDVPDFPGICQIVNRESGDACCADEQCRSGVCTDHVCCAVRCGGLDEACDFEGREGACLPNLGSTPTPFQTSTATTRTPETVPIGGPCTSNALCQSGSCINHTCEPARCGDGLVNSIDEDCDDGGVCIGGDTAGQHCTLESDCPGQGVCVGGQKALTACDGGADCPAGECIHCVPQGGDGCATNCTSETTVSLSLIAGVVSGRGIAHGTSGAILYQQFIGPFPFEGALTFPIGKERSGRIPVVSKPDGVSTVPIPMFGGCACMRRVAAQTCGGTLFNRDGSASTDCTLGYTAGESLCHGKPCAFVYGEGNSLSGEIGCNGLDGVDVNITQDAGVGSTPPGPTVLTYRGHGGPGSATFLSSMALSLTTDGGACAGSEYQRGADRLFCTDDDPPSMRGQDITLPLTTGIASGTVLNAYGGYNTRTGPFSITGSPLNCTGLSGTGTSGALAGAFIEFGYPLDDVGTQVLVVRPGPPDTPSATPTASPTPIVCVGDCNADRAVSVDEVLRGVNIALGMLPLSRCPSFDCNSDCGAGPSPMPPASVTCLIRGVNNALAGCPAAARCTSEQDCDDGNTCTLDLCMASRCLNECRCD